MTDCPARAAGAALVLTHVSVSAMNLLLEEIASELPTGTHAAMLIDNAGWHTANDLRVPPNITLVHLPPYSPALYAIEKVWQYLRDRGLDGKDERRSEKGLTAQERRVPSRSPRNLPDLADETAMQ